MSAIKSRRAYLKLRPQGEALIGRRTFLKKPPPVLNPLSLKLTVKL